MEPLQGDTVTNNTSCSCTSYDYNSESDCQTLIRLLAEGCRLNRLFNGKYVPLRESKLLDQLIRTRALYEALRNQLLSTSVSVSSKANLKPGEDSTDNTNSLEAKKSGDIFNLVDLVDKAAILGTRKLSVCCSCCNCNSKSHLHENVPKGRRNRQAHAGANMLSRSSVTSKHGTSEELKLGKQFKAKNIKSDPCTRAGKLEELIKSKLPRIILKKNGPEQPRERDQLLTITDKNKLLSTNNDKMKKSYLKLKRYDAGPTQYRENMAEGGITKVKKNNPYQDKDAVKKMSSMEQLKLAQQKIKDSFIADLKAAQKSKPEGDSIIKKNAENNAFPTRKNSAMKFKDKVSGKHEPEDWELHKRVGRTLQNNDQAENVSKNINTSGTPNFGVRREQHHIPGRTAATEQKIPTKNQNKNYTKDQKEVISNKFNNVTHAIANSIKLQKPKESDTSLVIRDKKPVKSMSSMKSDVRNAQYNSPNRMPMKQQQSPPKNRQQNYSKDKKDKAISKTFNKVTHAIANSIKQQKQEEPDTPLILRDKKPVKSMSSVNSNLHVRNEQYTSPKIMPMKQQQSPPRNRHQNYNKDQKDKAISKTFNKVTHAIANSIKQQKQEEPDTSLILRDKKPVKSMSSINSNLHVRNEQYASPQRIPTKQQQNSPRNRHQNYSKDQKDKAIPKTFNKVTHAIANSTKQEKQKEPDNSIILRDKKPVKSMSSIKSNLGVRNEQYASPKRIPTKQQQSPPRNGHKNYNKDQKEKAISKTFNKLTYGITNSIKKQKQEESDTSSIIRDKRPVKSMSSIKSDVRNEQYTSPKIMPMKQQQSPPRNPHQNYSKDQKDKAISKTFNKVTHAIANSIKQQKQEQSDTPLFLRDKKPVKSMSSIKSNLDVRNKQYTSPKIIPTKQQQKSPINRNQNYTLDEEHKVTKEILKAFNKERHGISVSIKQLKHKESHSLAIRDKKQSAKSRSSIKSHLGVRKEQFASPGRIVTKQQKSPLLRKRNKNENAKDISKTFNKVPQTVANSSKLQKPKGSVPFNLRDHKQSAKSMTLLTSNEGVNKVDKSAKMGNKMENLSLSKARDKKPIKSKKKRISSKILKAISTTSIKKLPFMEKNDRKVRRTVTQKPPLNLMHNNNKIKSDPSILLPKEIKSSEVPKLFDRRRLHIKPPTQHEENRDSDQDPDSPKKLQNIKQKQKKKSKHSKSHALKHCLCSLKIKIKKTKSAITKIVTGEMPQENDTQSIKSLDSKTSSHVMSVHKNSLKLKDRTNLSIHASKCECSDTNMNIKQKSGSNNDLRQTKSQSTIKTFSNHSTKGKNQLAHLNTSQKTISLISISECECRLSSKEKVSLKYKQTNTPIDIKSTNHASTETKEKGKFKNHYVQTVNNNVTIIEKQSRKLYPWHKTNITHHETKSIFNRVIIKENIIESSNKQEISIDYTSKPRFSAKFSKKGFSKNGIKIPLQPQTVHKDSSALKGRNKMTKCECSDTDTNKKQNRGSDNELRPENTLSTIEASSNHTTTKTKNNSAYLNTPHKTISSSLALKDRKKMSIHAAKCECSESNINIKQNRESNNELRQENTHSTIRPSSNHMTTKARNITDPETLTLRNNPYQTKSLIAASECECFENKEKGPLKYKQTNTPADIKSTNHASSVSKDKEKSHIIQYRPGQTITNVTNKEKQSQKLYPGNKTNTTHPKKKSIFNRVTKCKCPIATPENINVSSKKQAMNNDYTSKPRFSATFSKKAFAKDGLKEPLDTPSKIKQTNVHINCGCVYTGSPKLKHAQKKQSQSSNSTAKVKYTAAKHGLRRCFCTLKLGKIDKKKNKLKKHLKGEISNTTVSKSEYLKTHPKLGISISTEKREIYPNDETVSTKREARKLKKHIKSSKNRSKASLTSRSVELPRSKKIHSILVSHKSEISIQVLEKNKLNPHNTTQKVRSSFATKFLQKHPATYSPITKDSKIQRAKDEKNLQKSILARENKLDKNILLSSKIKRCLCTLKIHKKDKLKKKNIAIATDSNNVVEDMYPEMKSPIRSPIDIGTDTQKIKMISKSSDTRKLPNSSKLLFINSDFNKRRSTLQKLGNLTKHYLSKNTRPTYLKESLRQSVELGSNFSFNIEFYKEIIPENKLIAKRLNNMNVYFSKNVLEAKPLKINDSRKSYLKPTKVTLIPSVSKNRFCVKDEPCRDNLMTPFVIKTTPVYAMSTVTVGRTKMNLPEMFLLNEINLDPRCADSYHISNYTEKVLNKTKHWQHFKNRSFSSVYSKNMQSFDESKLSLLQSNSLNQSLRDFTSKEMVRFESKSGCEIYYEEKETLRRPTLRSAYSEIYSFAQKQDERKILEIQETKKSTKVTNETTNPSQLTGIQPFLRRCYCTMNVQVAQQRPKRRHHHQYPTKLKDYECDPGVCVPYECDPYECQKMIMKRLMKKVSRMSGTETRMKSSSSITSASSSGRRTRKLQSTSAGERQHRAAKLRHTGLKYQSLPRSTTQRQAVRVGSNFSFNMEFSKGSSKSAPTAEFIKEPVRPSTTRSSRTLYRRRRHRGTGYEVGRHHRESQSQMKQMRHRGSSVTPMLRRCFCTLKLQKKGRQQKERELQMHQGTSTPPKFYVEKPILRTTETSQNTRIKRRFPELLPYECEPNTCVPGECDPYECLELIRRRRNKYTRDLGTDSMKSNVTSSSSMTSSRRRTRRRHVQSRNFYVNEPRSRDTVVRSRPSEIESQVSPTKQAVRIGSNFSFNIEFFKDNAPSTEIRNMRSPEIYEHKPPRHVRKVPKHAYVHHKVRESSSQDRKSTRDTHSQMGLIKHGQSTMTGAFLKRCFCTAKLQGIKVDTEPSQAKATSQQHTSFSTMKRCLCHLKSLTSKKDPNKTTEVGNEQVTPATETHVVKTQTRARSPILEPYECEPGVCVPGFCDPYECEKMIRRRRAKEKMAGTTRPRTKSTSSSITSSKTSRARMTQSRPVRQYYERPRKRNYSPRDTFVKDKFQTPVLPQKQVVKIGSNFSFNIEFYKDNMANLHQVQAASTPVRRYRPTRDQVHEARHRYKTKDKNLMGMTSSVYTRGSQMDAANTKDQSLGPILKRCFCTLKLHKEKHIKKEKQMNQGTATPVIKEVPTLQSRSMMTTNKYKTFPYKLKPYECEPGVCVPGECDPFECDKRIRKRLMTRASGTLTDHYHTRSTASTIRPHRRYRDRDVQSMRHTQPTRRRDIQYKVRRPEMRSKVVDRVSKQAVKIGSDFSFNMEFFKDRSPGSSVASSRQRKLYGPYERPRRTTSRSTEWRSSSRNKKAQRPRTMRDMDSQVFAQKMRSTMTGVGPFLKRCFCTLQLHKSEKDKRPFNKLESVSTKTEIIKSPPKMETKYENTSTLTRTPAQFHNSKLEPYECEPGVCVPGECDPYECEKRIKTRLMQSKQSTTDPYRGRSVSSSIGESTKSRHRRIQALSYTPSGNRFRVEDRVPSTDSSPSRQAVRIGSSFSFNVEFYKDKSPQLPSARDVTKIIKRGFKGTETRPRRGRSTSSYSRRAHTRHCQSDCIKTECKSSCAPLLKRCFCTLKLQKTGKQQHHTTKIEPTMKTMSTLTSNKVEIKPVAREIGTKTKRYTHPLEPYECEPGVCVPGLCDPYECEKLIKLRHMKDFGTGTTRAPMKSMYSFTSRDMGTKAMNTYGSKNRKPPTDTAYKVKKPPRVENVNRQSVQLGSNFSFNIEFFKDRSSGQGGIHHTQYKPRALKTGRYKSKTSSSTANRMKLRNQGSHAIDKSLYHRQLQAGAQTESRGSGMSPLKRCFCTLTLQRAEVKNTISSPVAKNSIVRTQDKKTSTKKYNPAPVPLQLEPYECEPNICTPGECDPYECLERIKRRGIRRMSRTTGTRMKRTSQVSASSMAAQLMPGYTSKRTQFKTEGHSPRKVERIVEEPRFSFLNGNPNRQGVKISSNFSFNVEFFKETTPGIPQVAKTCPNKEICQVKGTCTKCKKTGHSTNMRVGQHGTRNYLHNNESQSDAVKTEDKSSAVAMLRRCFCTAKLHKSHLARSHYPQSFTVGQVHEIRPLSLFGPKEYWVQYQTQQLASKNTRSGKTKELPNVKSTSLNNKTGSNKLETIMSYTPAKFHKNNDTIKESPMIKNTEASTSTLRKILKCCKNLFIRRINQNEINKDEDENPAEVKPIKQARIDILKASKSERRPYNTATAAIKKSKSLKVSKTCVKNIYKRKYSRFQSGDANQSYNVGNKPHKNGIKFVKKSCPKCHVQFKQPLKQVHFSLSPKVVSLNYIMKPSKESKSVSFIYKASTFRKPENLKSPKLCSCCGGFKREKPLLSPGLNTTNAIPKEINIVSPQTRKKQHKTSCPCCNCRKKETRVKTEKQDTNTSKTEEQDTNLSTTERQDTNVTTTLNVTVISRKKRQPCISGSVACKKEAVKLADQQNSGFKSSIIKKWVCGTDMSAAESLKEPLEKESGYMRDRKTKKNQKAKMRDLVFKKEAKEIMKSRKLNDKYMMKKLKKYKETPDIIILAESLMNMCKLGIRSATEILRNVGRTVIDPKRTYRKLLMSLREPMRTWKKFQDATRDSPCVATLKRIKLRCKAMTFMKRGCENLGAHPVTNFVLHINDKGPRRRMNPKKVREPRRNPASGCSPFMLSLRKRPWLSSCAWFYPHCLSVLQVWKQFIDVTLFLLAVAVWSPCILSMELSRALMRCFLCTG